MDFDLNKAQEMIRKEVRRFAESEIVPVAADLDENETFSTELTRKMGEIGLFGMFVSEKYDGQGWIISPTSSRWKRSRASTAPRPPPSPPATPWASDRSTISAMRTQKAKYLPPLCRGEALWGFGLTEPTAGSDAGGSKTTAVKDGNEWVLNGSKIFITNAACDMSLGVTVQAITGTAGQRQTRIYLLSGGKRHARLQGPPMKGKMMWRSSNTAELYFDDVRVPAAKCLGKPGDGFHQMLQTLDGGRLSIAAMGLGGAVGAYEMALKYAKSAPVRSAHFQISGHRLQTGRLRHRNRMRPQPALQSLLAAR
jgi:short-chain 2-methylacyl-CoA dehydrogenase